MKKKPSLKYRRILLKLSGEALKNREAGVTRVRRAG